MGDDRVASSDGGSQVSELRVYESAEAEALGGVGADLQGERDSVRELRTEYVCIGRWYCEACDRVLACVWTHGVEEMRCSQCDGLTVSSHGFK